MNNNKLIFLYRHGETDKNVKDITMGQLDNIDTMFTEYGYNQITEISNNIIKNNIQIIYTSDLKRAAESAEIAVDKSNKKIPIEVKTELRGLNMGKLQGLLFKDFITNDSVKLSFKDHNIPFEDGESINHLNSRLITCIEKICNTTNCNRIGIVSHSAALSNLVSYLLNKDYLSLRMCCLLYSNGKLEVVDFVSAKENRLIVINEDKF